MCLITNDKTLYTAEEDITVYKTLRYMGEKGYANAVYQCHMYELGKIYTTEIKEDRDWCAYDSKDMAWLDSYCSDKNDWRYGKEESLICIGEGYHACMNKERPNVGYSNEYLYQCSIPKGAKYYKGPTGLIVSNKIIIVEKID